MMMRRWAFRLAFPALGLLIVLMFFGIKEPAPQTASTTEEPETAPSFEGVVPNPVPDDGPDIVFKWQDTDGSWHYADKPPTDRNWNALAVDPASTGVNGEPEVMTEPDWQSPYAAPFSLSADNIRQRQNAATP